MIVWVCPDCDQDSPTSSDFCVNCAKPRPVICQYRKAEEPVPEVPAMRRLARVLLLLAGTVLLGVCVPHGWLIGAGVYLMICGRVR